MSDPHPQNLHISSAVVLVQPGRAPALADVIDRLPGVDVYHSEGGKIVIVLEGPSSRAVGDRLAEIALLDGVISANLVYEQVETVESLGEPS